MTTTVTRRYRFSASHRLHVGSFSDEQNKALYGKCNNPFGHGHDYVLDVTVAGPVDPTTGKMFSAAALDRLVRGEILERFAYRNINVDIPEFDGLVTTTENICVIISHLLSNRWYSEMPKETYLHRVFIQETDRNSFEIFVEAPAQPDHIDSAVEAVTVHV